MLTIWLALYDLTMLAALAVAACSAAVANSCRAGRWSPSLIGESVARTGPAARRDLTVADGTNDHGSPLRPSASHPLGLLRKGRDKADLGLEGFNAVYVSSPFKRVALALTLSSCGGTTTTNDPSRTASADYHAPIAKGCSMAQTYRSPDSRCRGPAP